MEQISRICNIYLLIIALFQSIKSISYTGVSPLILIPLTSLILFNGFKDFFEDSAKKYAPKRMGPDLILKDMSYDDHVLSLYYIIEEEGVYVDIMNCCEIVKQCVVNNPFLSSISCKLPMLHASKFCFIFFLMII